MLNIISHLSGLLRMIENEIKNVNIPKNYLKSDVEINYIHN